MYYYRARFLDTGLSRFVSRDPAGFQGGQHLYNYGGNAPTMSSDPTGAEGFDLKGLGPGNMYNDQGGLVNGFAQSANAGGAGPSGPTGAAPNATGNPGAEAAGSVAQGNTALGALAALESAATNPFGSFGACVANSLVAQAEFIATSLTATSAFVTNEFGAGIGMEFSVGSTEMVASATAGETFAAAAAASVGALGTGAAAIAGGVAMDVAVTGIYCAMTAAP